jgi:hypothetical protein
MKFWRGTVASKSPCNRRRDLPLLDPQAFPFPARDGCDPRDSRGRIRSSGVSDAPIENDHMVEQISAAGAYPAFRNAVLPWTSEAGAPGLNAETLHCFDQFIIERERYVDAILF